MPGKKVYQLDETVDATGGLIEVTIPDGLGGWLSRYIEFEVIGDQINLLDANNNNEPGTLTNADLTGNVWEHNHGRGTIYVEVLMWDNNGVKVSMDGLYRTVDPDNFEVDFGGSIDGTWNYLIKYTTI